ncbi:hypothetical protein, partial [Hungatella effluvii]|uniref:hypothetical protein n=1 Tax=Hungatella effluvii TaxID=1096246 RepID=UPI002A7FB258
ALRIANTLQSHRKGRMSQPGPGQTGKQRTAGPGTATGILNTTQGGFGYGRKTENIDRRR